MTGEGLADPAGKNGRKALAGMSGMPCSGGYGDINSTYWSLD
jgi:hypothetical protein